MKRFVPRGGDERGIILPMTLIILTVLVTLVTAMLALGTTEPQIAANLVRGAQALGLAEAGADRAMAAFTNPSGTLGQCLVAAQNSDYTGSLAVYSFPAGCSNDQTKVTLYNAETLGAGGLGSYTVKFQPVSYATMLIESTGTTTSGITRVVRVMITRQWASKYGILANTVQVGGNGSVTGNNGAVQGNGSVSLGGSDWISQSATSSGDSTTCTGCTTASHVGDTGDSGAQHPTVPIPTMLATDFIKKATFIMGDSSNPTATLSDNTTVNAVAPPSSCSGQGSVSATGTVTVGASTTAYVPDGWILSTKSFISGGTTYAACTMFQAGTAPFAAWSGSGGAWTVGGGTAPDGLYYATVSANTSNNSSQSSGTTGGTWAASFAVGTSSTTGQIRMDGNGTIAPYVATTTMNGQSVSVTYPQMITGDIWISGTPSLTGTLIATDTTSGSNSYPMSGGGRSNLHVTGNLTLTGNLISLGTVDVSGHANINYNTEGRSHLLTPNMVLLSWHAISTLD